jgi:hypothetical protein
MRRSPDPDHPTGSSSSAAPDVERFVEDLRTAFPAQPALDRTADDHIAAMMAAVEVVAEAGTSRAGDAGGRPSSPRRRTMRHRITVRIAAVVTGLLLSMGGLAIAGAFPGSNDADDQQAVVNDLDETFDLPDATITDDQGEDADELADADDQGENEDAAENEDADENDDADETEDADDQGEDGDDQGEDVEENDADDQGEDEGDVEENDDQQGEDADDGIEDGGDSED